jgi:uncharacterized membrane protein YfcA
MEIITLILAFIISFGTMFLGAISGGVGLVLRPLLILIGFPAVAVVGSVRVASVAGELPGIFLLHKHKKIDWKLVSFLAIPMFLGSFIAGIAVLSILKGALEKVMGIILLAVGIILLIHRNAGIEERSIHISKTRKAVGFFGTMAISFLNTITGGMGPMFSSLYIANYGKTYINASALGKTTSYIGAGLASIVFIVGKAVDWQLALALVFGLGLGSLFGVHYGLKKGTNGSGRLSLLWFLQAQ